MAAQWILQQTTRSGLAGGLVATYVREVAARGRGDEVALLAPTQAAATAARRLVLESGAPALLDARLLTFPQLAEMILVANRREARQLPPLQRELLIGELLAELGNGGQLGYLQASGDKPGTLRAVGALLEEIKRGGISSDDFPGLISAALPSHPANQPVAKLFQLYQRRLQELQLYDEPGLFWNALEVLQQGERKPLEDLRVLLVDGFQEFTTTQLTMLQTLGQFLERVEIRLWLDDQRPHMTPRSLATRQWLQATVAPEIIVEDAAPAPPRHHLDRLRPALFGREEAGLTGADGSVQVLEVAGGVVGEARELARRLKRLLQAQPALQGNQIAIFLRSWDAGYDTALRQALSWYGVPANFARGPALAATPVVQAALEVLDVVVGGWLRQDVIKLLNSNYVQPLPETWPRLSARRLEQLALEAGIIGGASGLGGGREAWAQGLQQLHKRLTEERLQRRQLESDRHLAPGAADTARTLEDDEGNRLRPLRALERDLAYLEQAASLVNKLQELLLPLEQSRSLAAAAHDFGRILESLNLPARASTGSPERVARDLQGLSLLGDLLRSMAEAPHLLGLDPAGDGARFAARLREACCSAHLPGDQRQRSGVQVLDLAQAGLDPYSVVIVCGLRDGQFPASRRPDVIYSDASRQHLQQALPGLRPRGGQQEEEAYLLYGALAVAQEQLWLSYPQTEADGSPVLRSMYVDEVLRHWSTPADDPLPSALLSRRRQSEVIVPLAEAAHYLEALETVGYFRHPASPAALAAVQALTPPPGLPTAAQVQALAQMESRRPEQPADSPYGGWLRQPEILAQLHRDFGPERTLSVSQLNTYGGCPMRYYLSRVLGLEAPAEPSEGLDRRDIGTLVHRILALFFGQRTVGSDTCEPLTPANLAAAKQALRTCVEQVSNTWSAEVFGAPAVWERTIQRVAEDLQALLAYEASRYEATSPTVVQGVEVTFGARGSFALDLPGGETVKLRGRLDRLDLMDLTEADEQRWVIWDYKTNDGSSAPMIAQALDLQLAVYALAVEQVLYPGQAAGSQQWGYYRAARPVGWGGRLQRKANPEGPDNLELAMQTAREKIAAYVGALRQGDFPAQPNETLSPCRYCDFREICRVQAR